MYYFYRIKNSVFMSASCPSSSFFEGGLYIYMTDTQSWQLVSFPATVYESEICLENFTERDILLFNEVSQ